MTQSPAVRKQSSHIRDHNLGAQGPGQFTDSWLTDFFFSKNKVLTSGQHLNSTGFSNPNVYIMEN